MHESMYKKNQEKLTEPLRYSPWGMKYQSKNVAAACYEMSV